MTTVTAQCDAPGHQDTEPRPRSMSPGPHTHTSAGVRHCAHSHLLSPPLTYFSIFLSPVSLHVSASEQLLPPTYSANCQSLTSILAQLDHSSNVSSSSCPEVQATGTGHLEKGWIQGDDWAHICPSSLLAPSRTWWGFSKGRDTTGPFPELGQASNTCSCNLAS